MPKYWPRAFSGVGGSFYAGLVGVILVLVAPQALAYNDENPMLKWSPNYLFGSGSDGVGSRVPKSVYAYDNTFSPRVRFQPSIYFNFFTGCVVTAVFISQ